MVGSRFQVKPNKLLRNGNEKASRGIGIASLVSSEWFMKNDFKKNDKSVFYPSECFLRIPGRV